MRSFVLIFGLFLLSNSTSFAQTAIEQAIERLAKTPSLKNGSLSVSVIDVETGRLVASNQPHQSLIPASSLKVVTTSIALQLLGADYRFKTYLEYDGTIDSEGVLHGNIYIRGGGDPTLGSHHFAAAKKVDEILTLFKEAIVAKGIRKIAGKIIGDASFFDTAVSGRSWLWEDLGNYYGAGAWGLNWYENLFFLDFRQNKTLGGQPSIESIRPEIPNLVLINEVKLAAKGSGDNAYIFGSPYSYTRFVRGTIPVGSKQFTVKGSIPDPPFFAAYSLMKTLSEVGIETTEVASSLLQLKKEGHQSQPRTNLMTFESPDLKTIVEETNLKSVNLYCESLLRTIGKERGGVGSAEKGLSIIIEQLRKRKMNTDGFFMEDGSGLSVRNAVSSFHLATVMRLIAKDKKWYDAFYTSLPLAGRSGSLKYLFKGSVAEKRIRAKSGGMSRVRSYTGFAQTKSGKQLAFSIIANDFSGLSGAIRDKMEVLMTALCR